MGKDADKSILGGDKGMDDLALINHALGGDDLKSVTGLHILDRRLQTTDCRPKQDAKIFSKKDDIF